MPGGPQVGDDEDKEGENWFAGGERRCVKLDPCMIVLELTSWVVAFQCRTLTLPVLVLVGAS